ncbi:zinc finger Y-chromosomal protein 1 [Cochliomyia hominivorax]
MFNTNLKLTLCRTCLTSLSKTKSFHIFHTLDLAKKLILCSSLPAEATDEYPENVCLPCYEQITLFYDFQQMCCRSLDKFNELLKTQDATKEENLDQDINVVNEQAQDPLKEEDNIEQKLNDNKTIADELLEKKKRGRRHKKKLEIKEFYNDKEIEEYEEENNPFKKAEKKIINHEVKTLSDNESCTSSSLEHLLAKKLHHKCDRCEASFSALHRLEAHKRQHDGLSPYSCTFPGCERTFNRWYFYNKHQEEHNSEQSESNYKCDVGDCQRIYKNKSALNVHKRKFHHYGPALKSHMCEVCGKVFKSSAVLNDHRYTHFDKTELPFACDEAGCAKRFSNKEKLKVHKMRHAGIKNFICPYCGMRKTTRNELKIHINYHTLERTWPCRFCPKVCNSAGNLKMHIKNMHERAKDFACRYCEKTFAKADTKKYHEMTHTGEKPHECKECGRRFLQPAALRTHRKIHLRQKGELKEKKKTGTGNQLNEVQNFEMDIPERSLFTETLVAQILNDNDGNLN